MINLSYDWWPGHASSSSQEFSKFDKCCGIATRALVPNCVAFFSHTDREGRTFLNSPWLRSFATKRFTNDLIHTKFIVGLKRYQQGIQIESNTYLEMFQSLCKTFLIKNKYTNQIPDTDGMRIACSKFHCSSNLPVLLSSPSTPLFLWSIPVSIVLTFSLVSVGEMRWR